MAFISSWAQGIIIAVIIATIIEMILPNSNNSKYIKVVIGIFILFTIVSPIINKFGNFNDTDIGIDSYIEASTKDSLQTSVNLNNDEAIKKMYEENLKVDIKTKLAQKGYEVEYINLEILNNTEYTLNKIDIKISARIQENNQAQNISSNATTIIENIENIRIDIGGSRNDEKIETEKSVITETEKRKIKEYLSNVYEVRENNIFIQ